MSFEYITPEVAANEALRRVNDENLQATVDEFLGGVWPEGFEEVKEPQAIFAPYLRRGSVQEVKFSKVSVEVGFIPVLATYRGTEYVTANSGVVDCYRAPLILPKQQVRKWIVEEKSRPGQLSPTPSIYDGLSVEEYWKGIARFVENKNGTSPRIVDFSSWYEAQSVRFGWQGERSKSSFYYIALMALYASGRAVLYDTPATEFFDRVMSPAAKIVYDTVGCMPLITCEFVPLKRDWVDLSFLSDEQANNLLNNGRIER